MTSCGSDRKSEETAAPANPKRIVSLAPNLTETIYAIGGDDRLIGVTQYCKFPPEARKKPGVGALVNLDYERLRSLDPDLVVNVPAQGEFTQKLTRLGIPTLTFRSESIADIHANLRTMGKLLGREEQAQIVIAQCEKRMEEIRARVGNARSISPPGTEGSRQVRVLIVVGRNPGSLQQIYGCGSGNYLNELLEAVGAFNVLGETGLPWPVVSKEAIVQLDPDVILDGSLRAGDAPVDGDAHMRIWEQLSMLRAVKNKRVTAISNEHLLIPGPGFVDDAEWLARAIYGAEWLKLSSDEKN